jgi:hypothetical protein
VATEGPLGWAARGYCHQARPAFHNGVSHQIPRDPACRAEDPAVMGLCLFRHFHKHSSGVMVPTHGVLRMLEQRGFKNLRSWTHGVDTGLFGFEPQPRLYPPMGTLVRPVSLLWAGCRMRKTSTPF